MVAEEQEVEETVEDEDDDDLPLDEVALEEVDEDDEAEALAGDDEEDGDEASLDELLAERASARKGSDEIEEDEDVMALVPEPEIALDEVIPARVIPVKDQEEFVCARCHLVKKKVQLVDTGRQLCRDCA